MKVITVLADKTGKLSIFLGVNVKPDICVFGVTNTIHQNAIKFIITYYIPIPIENS